MQDYFHDPWNCNDNLDTIAFNNVVKTNMRSATACATLTTVWWLVLVILILG